MHNCVDTTSYCPQDHIDLPVCCKSCEIVQLVNRSKDEYDSEVHGLQNVHICVATCPIYYPRRYGDCTNSACFSYRVIKRIKTVDPGEKISLVCNRLKENRGRNLYAFNACMSLCRELRAVSGEGHTCEMSFSKTGVSRPKASWTEGFLTATTVPLARPTNKRSHFLSGCEQGRDPASVPRWNTGSMQEMLM